MNHQEKLALFDFDGTITKTDTLFTFTKFAVGNARFYFGLLLLSFPLALQKINLISAQRAKEIFLSYFFKGITLHEFDKTCDRFVQEILREFIRPQALSMIKNLQQQQSKIFIVSASPVNWIKPWATPMALEVIATELESEDGKLTGKIAGKNCNGVEKVNRIRKKINLEGFKEIIAYGDSKGDLPMLQLASTKFYKPFRNPQQN